MLLRTLLQLSLMTPETAVPERSLQLLRQATEQQWQEAIAVLKFHRLLPLTFHALKRPILRDCVPRPILGQFMTSYMYSLRRNTLLYKTLATALEAAYAANIYPVLWKGIVLADQLYPDFATRMIGDIDWAIAPQDREAVEHLFDSLGFTLQEEMTTSDAIYFRSQEQIFFDVHHRVRLFEEKNHLSLTMEVSPRLQSLPQLHVLEPNAMLTHLTVHLGGHASETGPMLFWVLDFVFLLRKWGHRIDLNRLKLLMPDEESWVFLGRILRFLQIEFGEPLPLALAEFAQCYKPFTLESITRQCRLAGWHLDQPKGWIKLMACRLGLHANHPQEYPQAGDLLLWAANR
jgi:Uncharacterised nucleotidyltransferase